MNLLCPNCQKNLTIPDQNAGQVMKCPLCGRDFRAPTLPGALPPARSNAVPSPAGSPGAVVSPPTEPFTEAPGHPGSDIPMPSGGGGPAAPPDAAGHRRQLVLHLDPRFLRWVPPVAIVPVLVLTFLPWLGLYPGGKALYVQNAWQTAFGFGSTPDAELLQALTGLDKPTLDKDVSASGPMIFYILLLLVTVPLVVIAVIGTVTPLTLPPLLDPVLRWRSALAAGIALLGFLLLVLQVALGFSLESVITQRNQQQADEAVKTAQQNNFKGSKDPDYPDMVRNLGLARYGLERTTAYRVAVCLHFLAVLCLVLELWLERRGKDQPLPEVVLRW